MYDTGYSETISTGEIFFRLLQYYFAFIRSTLHFSYKTMDSHSCRRKVAQLMFAEKSIFMRFTIDHSALSSHHSNLIGHLNKGIRSEKYPFSSD